MCNLLDAVVDLVLEKQGWRWQKAVYQPDGYVEDAEVDGADINTDQQEDQLGMGTMAQEPEEEEVSPISHNFETTCNPGAVSNAFCSTPRVSSRHRKISDYVEFRNYGR